MFPYRVLSGMRPVGAVHLGHYHGVIQQWIQLQSEHSCFFMVADWHAWMTHYEDPPLVERLIWDMVTDWLAAGVDPAHATLFVQSRVPEQAELHLLLSMITPSNWLERVPAYKEHQDQLAPSEHSTYGFLGYPLLQASDILAYRATLVPVGEDQIPHIELTRDVARRFNHLYGKEPGFEQKAAAAIPKLGSKKGRLYEELLTRYQQEGDEPALEAARALVEGAQNLAHGDRERLYAYLEGGGRRILPEPQALLSAHSRMPGLDGLKMSTSSANTLTLRESADSLQKKIQQMPTDPARARRSDPGEPEKCPVWSLHQVYSDEQTRNWASAGCRSAGIGCLECKQPLIDSIIVELKPIWTRAREYQEDPTLVRNIIADGCEHARKVSAETLRDVREAMGLDCF